MVFNTNSVGCEKTQISYTQQFDTKQNQPINPSHGIHVWYIYLHLWLIFMVYKCIGKYTSPIGSFGHGATTQGDSEMLRQLRKHRNWMPRNKRKARLATNVATQRGGLRRGNKYL